MLKTFIIEIKIQFGVNIKNVCTDNATEFKFASFLQFYKQWDPPANSFVITPLNKMDNKVRFLKYRHFLNIARTIMLYKNIPFIA